MDSTVNVEEEAIRTVIASDIWSYVAQIDDKYHICEGIAKGTTEIEIAKVANVTQQAIHKNKKGCSLFRYAGTFLPHHPMNNYGLGSRTVL